MKPTIIHIKQSDNNTYFYENIEFNISLCKIILHEYFTFKSNKPFDIIIKDKPFKECYKLIRNQPFWLVATKNCTVYVAFVHRTKAYLNKFNLPILYVGLEQ